MKPEGRGMDEFWQSLSKIEFRHEAEVETRLLLPLLNSLEYRPEDIQPKVAVRFYTGRAGRPHEADLVAFTGPDHNRNTSLLVIEAKPPNEPVASAKDQAESYAKWLRAPVYLQTNGRHLEIWQLQTAWESVCVFKSPVRELFEQRGELEFILRKSALIEHCRKLKLKVISFEDADVGPYVEAVASIAESPLRTKSIDRRLIGTKGGTPVEVATCEMLKEFPRGCVVRAGSGVGKTTLALQLLDQSLQGLTAGGVDKLPIEVYLPDVAALGVSLVEFAKDRLAPHVPQYGSEASFRQLLRRGQIRLTCDAFDRVPIEQRPRIAAEMRAFVKDYPRSQLFVFSRPPASAELGFEALPFLDLDLMDDQEMLRMAEVSAGRAESQSSSLLQVLPSALKEQCKIPFLFDILLQDYTRLGQVPRDIITPFRRWIHSLIRYDSPSLQTTANRLMALKAIAAAIAESLLPLESAVETLMRGGLSEGMLGDLEACGLIQQRPGHIELLHEALGDFLKAEGIASIPNDTEFQTEIEHTSFGNGSALAIFLAGLLPSPQRQKAFWDILLRVEFDTYLSALRFRADLSIGLMQATERDEFQLWFLSEILDGFDDLARTHFRPWIDGVRPYSVRSYQSADAEISPERLVAGITGQLTPDNKNLRYSYRLVPDDHERVVIQPGTFDRYLNLGLLGLPPDSGRVIGTRDFYKEILRSIDACECPGGPTWCCERLISSLRKLEDLGTRASTQRPLTELRDELRPYAGQVVPLQIGERIEIDLIINDIEELLGRGYDSVVPHLPPGPDLPPPRRSYHWSEVYSQERLRDLVVHRYTRIHMAYKEVAEAGFLPFLRSLRHYAQLPIRLLFGLQIPEKGDHLVRGPVLWSDWEPVSTWDEFSVEVEFVDGPPERNTEARAEQIQDTLRKMGRRSDIITFGGWSLMDPPYPSFRSNGQTAIVNEVIELIREDVQDLFRELRVLGGW